MLSGQQANTTASVMSTWVGGIVNAGVKQDADDFDVVMGGGGAKGVIVIGMDVGAGVQRRLDAIDVAKVGRCNECFVLRWHALILAATA